MTDKQIVKTLKNIKDYCAENDSCRNCKFYVDTNRNACLLSNMASELKATPTLWNIEKLEVLINEK